MCFPAFWGQWSCKSKKYFNGRMKRHKLKHLLAIAAWTHILGNGMVLYRVNSDHFGGGAGRVVALPHFCWDFFSRASDGTQMQDK